jgi:hypothetical protein
VTRGDTSSAFTRLATLPLFLHTVYYGRRVTTCHQRRKHAGEAATRVASPLCDAVAAKELARMLLSGSGVSSRCPIRTWPD